MTRLLVLQHLERECPGLFAQEARARGWELVLCRLDLGEAPPPPQGGDLLLVLGGPMGVADVGSPAYPWLEQEGILLRELPLERWQALHPSFEGDIYGAIAPRQVVAARGSEGGTAFEQVRLQLQRAQDRLSGLVLGS